MPSLGLAKIMLDAVGLTIEDLEEYKIDPKKVCSTRFIAKGCPPLAGMVPPPEEQVGAPSVGVRSDYFDQYLETLKNSVMGYHLFKKPYRFITLKGANFEIVDDDSLLKYEKSLE